jgi:hypothetical protein
MSRSIRRLAAGTLSLLAVLAGAVAVAAPAQAASLTGRQLVQSATANTQTSSKTHKVYCPAGKVIISGGAYVDGPHTIRINMLRPDSYGNYFEAAAHTTWGRPTWRLYVYGICADRPSGLTYVTASSAPNSTDQRYAAAYCPKGLQVLGGGGRAAIETGRNVVLDWVLPGWPNSFVAQTHAAEGGEPDPWTTEAYAVCAQPVGAVLETASTGFASPSATSVFVSCDTNQLVAAGGALFSSAPTTGQIGLFGVYSNDLTHSVVFAGEDGTGTAGTWRAGAYAICL